MERIKTYLTKYLASLITWLTAPPEAWMKRMIKIAAVFLTLPATIIVAGEHLYPDQPLLKVVSQIAAAILTEATLLLGWNMLDKSHSSQATTAQRWLYTALSLVAYGVLWVVALYHGEGGIGIAFRLTLLVDLIYSVWESGILANIRLQRSASRDIRSHRRVRHARERAELDIELLKIKVWRQEQMRKINPNYQPRHLGNMFGLLPAQTRAQLVPSQPEPEPEFNWSPKKLELARHWEQNPTIGNTELGKLVDLSDERVRQIKNEMRDAGIIHVNGKVEFLKPIPKEQ